jgi:hypothetical protein
MINLPSLHSLWTSCSNGQLEENFFAVQVMKLLELNEIEDKLVGSIGDGGLSVEEAKRLTIGVELVS